MQLVVFAVLGCCVVAHSASLSDTLGVSRPVEGDSKNVEADAGADPNGALEVFELTDDGSRIKRSGGGSGGFLAGIGSAILGKVASASSGLSSGSGGSGGTILDSNSGRDNHQYEEVEYGAPVYGHDNNNNFDIWSFKKAILNTLFQALKAIGGGVIALKGKLIKGGGVIVSTKGRLISAKGEAISNLGRQIAASAVLSPPKQIHTSYIYETPPVHIPAAVHNSYGGPVHGGYGSHGGYSASASSDSYGHSGYASPSDDAAHPGLLILKSLTSEDGHQNYGQKRDAVVDSKSSVPNPIDQLSESFGGYQKDSGRLGSLVEGIAEASDSIPSIIAAKNLPKKLSVKPVNYNNGGHSLAENIGHQQPGKNYEPLKLPQESTAPVQFSTQEEQQQQLRQQQQQQFSDPRGYTGNNNNVQQQLYSFPGLMISRPIEIPILQSQQSLYYPKQNQNYLQDYYVGPVKRSGQFNGKIRVEPAIGYEIKDSRAWRL